MLSQAVIAYLAIGAFLVLVYPLRKTLSELVRKTKSKDRLGALLDEKTPAPAWKFVAMAALTGILFAVIWPVAMVSWYRHFR